MLKRKILKPVLLLLFLLATHALMLSSASVYACFDPTDKASIEVVLNKPGITYDLSRLREIKNIIEVEPGRLYIYRSHVHREVVVVLSLQKLVGSSDKPEYLAVRVESPLAKINKTVMSCGIDIVASVGKISTEHVRKVAEELGWYASIEEVSDGYIKGYLEKLVENTTIRIHMVGTRGSLKLSIRTNGKSTEIVNEVNKLLAEAFNLSGGAVSSDELNCFVVPVKTPLLKPAVGDGGLREAIVYELRWLTRVGVIKGLTEADMIKLTTVAEPGLAGWNERLVYWGGSWHPYSKLVTEGLIEGGYLIRGPGGCSWDYPLDKLPTDPPEEPPIEGDVSGNLLLVTTAVAVALAAAITIVFIVFIKQSRTSEI